eukprot:TRINITY_DN5702_c0_g1_i1.p1 TRINITY_DN5702_c0_g1~~TRINITY_DN5702_c0_g1_i1.p1  ORF type:complete len:299 (-),score=40.38 TRINITY_DN5702_c0_g1_i1:136-957(-)
MSQCELGYWAIRGLAAPARMLFAYSGTLVKEFRYPVVLNEDGTQSKAEWFEKAKPALLKENPLTNLPWMRTPSGSVVTQSNSVYRTAATLTGLAARTPAEAELVDQILDEVMDIRNTACGVFYGRVQGTAAYLSAALNGSFTKLERWFAQRKSLFAAGDEPRVCDFHLWEMIDQHIKIFGVLPAAAKAQGLPDGSTGGWSRKPTLPDATAELFAAYDAAAEDVFPVERFPNLRAFHARFRSLPQLQTYFSSDAYRLACNNSHAVHDPATPIGA